MKAGEGGGMGKKMKKIRKGGRREKFWGNRWKEKERRGEEWRREGRI